MRGYTTDQSGKNELNSSVLFNHDGTISVQEGNQSSKTVFPKEETYEQKTAIGMLEQLGSACAQQGQSGYDISKANTQCAKMHANSLGMGSGGGSQPSGAAESGK